MSEVTELKVETLRKVLQKYDRDSDEYKREQDSYRLGKVLTVIDGAIADETQRKAVKDLIHDSWYSNRNMKIYPSLHHVTKALGFELWEETTIPVSPADYNPYESLVKE